MQFLLAKRSLRVLVNGYFGPRTDRAVRRFQRHRHLAVDGIAGPHTLSALRAASGRSRPHLPAATPVQAVRSLLDHWSAHYGVDHSLVRALAWMESGYQPNLTSPVGAWGVLQILPSTWSYAETILIGSNVPRTVSGNIRVGVAFIRHLLKEFDGDQRLALAAWYQGPTSVQRHGPYRQTRAFVADVLALKERSI